MDKSEAIKNARSLFLEQSHGVLATHAQDVAGYPFGSLVTYSVDQDCQPLILISNIAQHTKNIEADNKVSLTVLEPSMANVQASGRLTYIADVVKLNDKVASERYFNYFPEARHYGEAHGFDFYKLDLVRVRYIGGFGAIFWIERDEFLIENPFWSEAESGIVGHMNEDHSDALKTYCQKYKDISVADSDELRMIGIDSEGFDLLLNGSKLRFGFESPIKTSAEARQALIAMLK